VRPRAAQATCTLRAAQATCMVAVMALVAGLVAPPASAGGGPAPLEQARDAAEHTVFEGILEVRWRDGDETRSERLRVEAAGGSLMVRGANLVMARPEHERLLAHGGGGWEEMWLPSLAPTTRPDGTAKYRTTAPAPGPAVAGRPTKVVEVHTAGDLLERLFLDTETNLLLERDQYDRQGAVMRRLAFESLSIGVPAAPLSPPRSPAKHAPYQVAPERLSSPAAAPESLADGYQRMGIYKSGSVLQVLYSDGLYDLSLFQQQGRLRGSDLPGKGERVSVRGTTGWRYPWPGGQLVVWSAGGRVFTAVSDAPADQVLTAVRSLPRVPGGELSLLGKIRRAAQALVQPFA
jgi:negative regulator of sigma E activity